MKKVILGLLLVAGSLPAIAQTTEKTNDMDRIELCKENYTALFGGEALNGGGTDPDIMDILQKDLLGDVFRTRALDIQPHQMTP